MLPALVLWPCLEAWGASRGTPPGSGAAWNAFAVATIGSVAVTPRLYGWTRTPTDVVTPVLRRMLAFFALPWFWVVVIAAFLGSWSTRMIGRTGRALWVAIFFGCALAISFVTIALGKLLRTLT